MWQWRTNTCQLLKNMCKRKIVQCYMYNVLRNWMCLFCPLASSSFSFSSPFHFWFRPEEVVFSFLVWTWRGGLRSIVQCLAVRVVCILHEVHKSIVSPPAVSYRGLGGTPICYCGEVVVLRVVKTVTNCEK